MLYRREIERREKDGLQPNRREERDKGFNNYVINLDIYVITLIGYKESSDLSDKTGRYYQGRASKYHGCHETIWHGDQ